MLPLFLFSFCPALTREIPETSNGIRERLIFHLREPHETILFLPRKTRKSRKSYPRATGGREGAKREEKSERRSERSPRGPGLPLYQALCTTLGGF